MSHRRRRAYWNGWVRYARRAGRLGATVGRARALRRATWHVIADRQAWAKPGFVIFGSGDDG